MGSRLPLARARAAKSLSSLVSVLHPNAPHVAAKQPARDHQHVIGYESADTTATLAARCTPNPRGSASLSGLAGLHQPLARGLPSRFTFSTVFTCTVGRSTASRAASCKSWREERELGVNRFCTRLLPPVSRRWTLISSAPPHATCCSARPALPPTDCSRGTYTLSSSASRVPDGTAGVAIVNTRLPPPRCPSQ